MRKDLLSINSLSKQEIEELISYAIRLKEKRKDGGCDQPLKGKTLGMLFEKPSTRTRVSFEV
ncbi:MAG: ornithine carbamoyltransferase, partial [Deltaproteobacteria bacterium]|nr:ornithine carbamoyltransferase [Deltaproteobacteria bacterium]